MTPEEVYLQLREKDGYSYRRIYCIGRGSGKSPLTRAIENILSGGDFAFPGIDWAEEINKIVIKPTDISTVKFREGGFDATCRAMYILEQIILLEEEKNAKNDICICIEYD